MDSVNDFWDFCELFDRTLSVLDTLEPMIISDKIYVNGIGEVQRCTKNNLDENAVLLLIFHSW